MRPNSSEFPYDHAHPISKVEELNHPLIPKLYYYDDNKYECEYIDGEDLVTYLERTGDISTGILVYELVQDLMIKMSKISNTHNWEDYSWKGPDLAWKLGCDDIHAKNILVTNEGKPYLIDFDQFGWYHPYTIFKLLDNNTGRISDAMRYAMLAWDSKVVLYKVVDQNKEMHEKNVRLFEDGVRHGFWNVNSIEEIKEKYEKYKNL